MQMAMAGLPLRGALIKQTICIVRAKGNQTAISGHPVQSSVYRSPVYRLILFSHIPEQCPDVKGLFRMPLYIVFDNLNSLGVISSLHSSSFRDSFAFFIIKSSRAFVKAGLKKGPLLS